VNRRVACSRLFLGAAGCALHEGEPEAAQVAFYIDDSFSPDEANEVQRAADAWNGYATTQLVRVADPNAYVASTGERPWVVLRSPVSQGFCGRAESAIGIVRVDLRCGTEAVYPTALHEFGHVLGLGHLCSSPGTEGDVPSGRQCDPDAPPLGVMGPSAAVADFTGEDRAECRRVRACR